MAEALAVERNVPAESAGVAAQRSDHAAPFAVRALRSARGLDLGPHTPRSVDAVDLSEFDHVVAMAPNVARQLRSDATVTAETIMTWTIPDPYGGTLGDYRYCLEQIDWALERLLNG